MKVFQINTVCGYGSTGRIAAELGAFLQNNGHECLIAYGRSGGNGSYFPTCHIGSDLISKQHAFLSRITDRQGFYSSNATRHLIDKIEKYQPDILHLHNIHGYYLNISLLFNYLKTSGIPVVWTFHDCWPFTGHCSYFDMANCNKWKTGCNQCPQRKEYPASYILDNSYKNYQEKKKLFTSIPDLHIITPSEWLNRLVGESFFQFADHRVINNGINLETFKPTSSGFRKQYGLKDKIILLGVASIWGERKGFEDFIRLSERLDDQTVIVMVGVNDQQQKSLPENIIGIRRTNNIDELCGLYTAADYFLNLTYQDNFPTVNIEALACGTPVITYRTGGSIESITEKCGCIVECGDFAAIPQLIRQKKYDSQDCVSRAFEYESNVKYQEYYNFYRELLNHEV